MKTFADYFSDEIIIGYLCKLRCKVAMDRNKKHLIHLMTNGYKYNYHIKDKSKDTWSFPNELVDYQSTFGHKLNSLLPARKKWVSIGEKSRKKTNGRDTVSANERNYDCLIKTIKRDIANKSEASYIKRLKEFILDIQISVADKSYKFKKPVVYPKLKDKIVIRKDNVCRPISLFDLKDRIILSITNKFLTQLLDGCFENSSYAFRSRKNGNEELLSHHDCITDILNFQRCNREGKLWAVECDMKNFYDSVNHDVILTLFTDLIRKVEHEQPDLDLASPIHLFKEFLSSYSFTSNVLPLNLNDGFWADYKIPRGKFGWVQEGIDSLKYYSDISNERIGIPQGGALSGLIANIVLDFADKELMKTKVFYARFCDDMIILHHSYYECKKAKAIYMNCLRKLKLIPHEFENPFDLDLSQFWKVKSKGPYRWCSIEKGGFPWIAFVGYEMHFSGYVRVRKKSLEKELEKQKEVIIKLKQVIGDGNLLRKSYKSISESAIHRLVGMSVGRVTLHNFKEIGNELCWKAGFRQLSMNKYSVKQIKHLDRSRNKLYYDFQYYLKMLEVKKAIGVENQKSRNRKIIHFNKPFSYYYQVLERSTVEVKSIELKLGRDDLMRFIGSQFRDFTLIFCERLMFNIKRQIQPVKLMFRDIMTKN